MAKFDYSNNLEKTLNYFKNNKFIVLLILISIIIISLNNLISAIFNIKQTATQTISKRIISVNFDLIFDAGNVIGMAPLFVGKMNQVSSQDTDGIEEILNNKDVGIVNWLPFSLEINNISKDEHVILNQITFEITNYQDINPSELHKIFDIYTGDYQRYYESFNVKIDPDLKETGLFKTKFDKNQDIFKKKFYEIPPNKSEKFLISLTGKEVGKYDLRYKVAYSVNGVKKIEYGEEIRFIQLDYEFERAGNWSIYKKKNINPIKPNQPDKEKDKKCKELANDVVNLSENDIAKFIAPYLQGIFKGQKEQYTTIQVGAYKNKDNVDKMYLQLKKRGYPVYIRSTKRKNDSVLYQLRVGAFLSKFEAEIYGDILKIKENLDIYIVEIDGIPESIAKYTIGDYLYDIKTSGLKTREYVPPPFSSDENALNVYSGHDHHLGHAMPGTRIQKRRSNILDSNGPNEDRRLYIHFWGSSKYENAFDKGIEFIKNGQYKEANEMFKKAIELKPDYFEAYYELAITFRRLNNQNEALKAIQRAIELNPMSTIAYYEWGNCLSASQHHEKAIVKYQKAIEINPNFANAYYGLGVCLAEVNNYKEAIFNLKKAIDLSPENGAAWYMLGKILGDLGFYNKGAYCLERAIKYGKNIIQFESELRD